MIPRTLLFTVLFTFYGFCQTTSLNNTIWIQKDIVWHKSRNQHASNAIASVSILVFKPNNEFIEYSLVLISFGKRIKRIDESNHCVIYTGKWSQARDSIIVTKKLIKESYVIKEINSPPTDTSTTKEVMFISNNKVKIIRARNKSYIRSTIKWEKDNYDFLMKTKH